MKTLAFLVTTFAVNSVSSKTVVGFGISGGTASVKLEVGMNMLVSLESNPTTGYDWELQGTLPSCLSMKSMETRKVSEEEHARIGAPSVKEIAYAAVAPCSVDLEYIYSRYWTKNDTNHATIHLTVARSEQ